VCEREGKREREIKNEMVLDNRIKFYKINNRTAFRVTVFYLKKMDFREKREKERRCCFILPVIPAGHFF